MLQMDRQAGQIGVLASQDHRVHRGRGAVDLDQRLRDGKPVAHGPQQLTRRHAEAGGDPRAAAGHPADQLRPFRARVAEQHRLGIAVEHTGDVDQIDRPVVDLGQILFDQPVDEAAQPEGFHVRQVRALWGPAIKDLGHRSSSSKLVGADVRQPPPPRQSCLHGRRDGARLRSTVTMEADDGTA